MRLGVAWEGLADAQAAQARGLPPGEARAGLLRRADRTYAELSSRFLGAGALEIHAWRLLHKHAACLLELDPEGLARLFAALNLRGYLPKADADKGGAGRWGYRERFDDLRRRLGGR
jgi:hypothetical protein